ncbi:TFIIB-type zinc ribbon-containing protein [Halorubellus sp. JP-L1]|uniref:DUF7117 family protein n=1 Tax=Halorubellus sp. JP-L1 TaxID=2715753 RepID=UPI001407ED3C|nr:TFIIB-type zinc ribbon-containing protein [Halorubellus sp. JP-L1]NHN40677.1 TFIIB-type zinc ribbon-containing protein [Halorubellus sp. JP-L1]
MEIRGERECTECERRWSYYDTGSVACPDCGSMRSVGLDEDRALHTTTPAEFDLTEARAAWDDRPRDEAVDVVKAACREFVRGNGFVHAGDLVELDGRRIAARELANAVDVVGRTQSFDDESAVEYYLLSLLQGTDAGDRPDASEVPESMRAARGLATAAVVERYRRDVRDWLEATDRDLAPAATDVLTGLESHQKRMQALQGDVDPHDADALYEAARGLNAYLRDGDEDAVVTATERLRRLRD